MGVVFNITRNYIGQRSTTFDHTDALRAVGRRAYTNNSLIFTRNFGLDRSIPFLARYDAL
jgi:hypothetical protein